MARTMNWVITTRESVPQVTTSLLVLSSASAVASAPSFIPLLTLPPVSAAVLPTLASAASRRFVSASMPGGSQKPVEDAAAVGMAGICAEPVFDMASAIRLAAVAISFIFAMAGSAWLVVQASNSPPKVRHARPERRSASSKR